MIRGMSIANPSSRFTVSTAAVVQPEVVTETPQQRRSSRLHRVSMDSTVSPGHDVAMESSSFSSISPTKRKQRTTPTSAVATGYTIAQTEDSNNNNDDDDDDDDDHNNETVEVFPFNGVNYTSYQDMVNAKRQRNQQILEQSGLLSSSSALRRRSNDTGRHPPSTTNGVSKRGIQANKKRIKHEDSTTGMSSSSRHKNQQGVSTNSPQQRRKSSRLQGVEADGFYIDEERAGRVVVAGHNIDTKTYDPSSLNQNNNASTTDSELYYRNRINDGAPLSLSEAMESAGSKWMTETSIPDATAFVQQLQTVSTPSSPPLIVPNDIATTTMAKSPNKLKQKAVVVTNQSNTNHRYDISMVQELECDDIERNVAKICPDRIYSMAVHPTTDHLIVCAGDKSGHLGIWKVMDSDRMTNVDRSNHDPATTTTTHHHDRDGIHLFKPHTGAICCLQWTGGGSSTTTTSSSSSSHNLISASYDGTIRMLDVQQEQFVEVYATYNNYDSKYQHRPGFGIEQNYGNKFWTQHICLDPRYNESTCFFISTSVGTAMHIDLRSKDAITFHEQFSEKKVNTLSLHPNGYALLSGGLDNTIALWDVRKLRNSLLSKRHTTLEPISYYNCGRSINSVYFSPSGKYAVSTTMANKLDIFEDLHFGVVDNDEISKKSSKSSSNNVIQPMNSIRHDNMTGRWLTTFQAIFHPQLDLFVVGSMRQPRCIELFDPTYTDHGSLIRTIQGDGLTAVVSRLAFHPRTDQLIVCGGNSSGRVTIVRK